MNKLQLSKKRHTKYLSDVSFSLYFLYIVYVNKMGSDPNVGFEVTDMFEEAIIISDKAAEIDKKYNIAVAETGYVGLSIATLLSQHNHVTAVDIIEEKVDMINNRKSPIQDDYIEK